MQLNQRDKLFLGLLALAILSRFLPHPPNCTAVGAVGLFCGATMIDRRWAYLVPLLSMLISDCVFGFHAAAPAVYLAMMLYVALGSWAAARPGAGRLAGATLAGAISFFLITNFACWLGGYEWSAAGLIRCYSAAMPFFRYTLAGDLVYATTLFGARAVARSWFPAARLASPATIASNPQ